MEPFRFVVQDAYAVRGRAGPMIRGRISSGRVAVGDHLELRTGARTVSVRVLSIEKAKLAGFTEACAGPEDVALEVSGVAHHEVQFQSILAERGAWREESEGPGGFTPRMNERVGVQPTSQ